MKKKNLALIISAVALIIIAIIVLVIINVVQGVDFVALLTSKWAITIEITIGLYALIVGIIIIKDWVKGL